MPSPHRAYRAAGSATGHGVAMIRRVHRARGKRITSSQNGSTTPLLRLKTRSVSLGGIGKFSVEARVTQGLNTQ